MPVTRSIDTFSDLRLNNGRANNRDAGDLRRHRSHYDVTVISVGGRGRSQRSRDQLVPRSTATLLVKGTH